MILVDSSVWVGYFNGNINPQTDKLDALLGREPVAIGDLILAEVLQGFDSEREFRRVRNMLDSFLLVELGGRRIAIQAAKNFRALRRLGVTVRKTIDTIIAARCIEDQIELLHNDRDFDPFAEYPPTRARVPGHPQRSRGLWPTRNNHPVPRRHYEAGG